jgi:hypothetical protein
MEKSTVGNTMGQRFDAMMGLPLLDQIAMKVSMQSLDFLVVEQLAFYLGYPSLKRFQNVVTSGRFDLAMSSGVASRRFHRETIDRIILKGMKQAVNA